MRVILRQTFPLGRYHANPWRAFAFDDPHGEWPPSPWRLLRAILARSFQLDREREIPNADILRKQFVRVFCQSSVSWNLPTDSWRGPGLQQYQPSEFKKNPAAASKPGEKTYNTTKNKDNFWLISPENDALYWILDGEEWPNELLTHLDDCLARMTYFGRAESVTSIERIDGSRFAAPPASAVINLSDTRSATAVAVLCPQKEATLEQVTCQTHDKAVADSTTPPGAVWKFAVRPARAKPAAKRYQRHALPPIQIVQFAVGGRVFPPLPLWIRITERFRGRVIRILKEQNGGSYDGLSLFTGKHADGSVLAGHRHAAFFLVPDSSGKPSRLVCWRKEPFTDLEQTALFAAAEWPISWDFGSDNWQLRLVPLPAETPFAESQNIFADSLTWESLTPFVPPLHFINRKGDTKAGYDIETQIKTILVERGISSPVAIDVLSDGATWVKVHRPQRSRDGQTNDDKRAFRIRLTFPSPISGPLCLGHSSHFGLGLFAAVPEGRTAQKGGE